MQIADSANSGMDWVITILRVAGIYRVRDCIIRTDRGEKEDALERELCSEDVCTRASAVYLWLWTPRGIAIRF